MIVMQAIESFATGDVVVNPNDFYADDHQLVRMFPSKFRPVEVISRTGAKVEAATAAPGEKRNTSRDK